MIPSRVRRARDVRRPDDLRQLREHGVVGDRDRLRRGRSCRGTRPRSCAAYQYLLPRKIETGFDANVESGEIPSFERRREHERLERRARLPLALHREVELARVEAAAAVHRDDRAVRRVDRDERGLRPVRARQPLVDRRPRELLQPQVDRRVHAEAAAEDALRAELVDRAAASRTRRSTATCPITPERCTFCGFGIGARAARAVLGPRDDVLLQHQPQHDRAPVLRGPRVRDRVVAARVLRDAGEERRLRAASASRALCPKYVRAARSIP